MKLTTNFILRDNRLLLEILYLSDYSYSKPIAKVIRSVNNFSDLMTLSRTRYRNEMTKKLREEINTKRKKLVINGLHIIHTVSKI